MKNMNDSTSRYNYLPTRYESELEFWFIFSKSPLQNESECPI